MKTWMLLLFCFVITGGLQAQDSTLNVAEISRPPEVKHGYNLPIPVQNLEFNAQNGRKFIIPLNLHGKTAVKVRIFRAHDNTGDSGLTWKLTDSTYQRTYGSGFSKSKKVRAWVIKDIDTFRPFLILEDLDTKFTGPLPGNAFAISVVDP